MMNPRSGSAVVSAEELLQMPDDGFRYELVRGELRRMTPSGYTHGVIVANLTVPVGQWVRSHALGQVCGAETGFRIARSPDTVRAPDISFIRQARRGSEPWPEGFFEGAPDLAVEVPSPSDTAVDVEEKIDEWLNAGCAVVWVVNPRRRSVSVHLPEGLVRVLIEDDTIDGGELLPGFALPVADIFRW
jgi:Uma2 family endonuclease